MNKSSPPEITLELSSGSLTIRTSQGIYHVVVSGASPALAPAEPVPALPGGEGDDWDLSDSSTMQPSYRPQEATGDDAYYRDLSNDMYREVGNLARRLNLSLKDVKVVKPEDMDLEVVGERLASAKGELAEVVEMTERATNRIIDQSESIQTSCDRAREIMGQLSPAEAPADTASAEQAQSDLSAALAQVGAYLAAMADSPLAEVTSQAEALAGALQADQGQAAPPQAGLAGTWQFPLEVVFQTIYELCTNETVKKHIKAMWDSGGDAFDEAAVEKGLNQLAPAEADEDNFLNLPLNGVLKSLFSACQVDRYKGVLKKMASTSGQIFLEQSLPLEATPGQGAGEPAAPQAGAEKPALAAQAEALLEALRKKSLETAPPALDPDLVTLAVQVQSGVPGGSGGADQDLLGELDQVLKGIFDSVGNIVEASSFQDLSGQAIYRIMRLLTSFQVQLLATVVSFGAKIKSRQEDRDITVDQSEKLAQEEVDKMMGNLGVADQEMEEEEGEAGKLDQDQVNNLLEALGF